MKGAGIVILLVAMLPFWGSPMLVQAEDTLPNVIIITMSGVRNSETIADPSGQYIRNLRQKMFPEGALYTNLVNTNYEFHMPSVQAINTGHSHYAWGQLCGPAIFQLLREQHGIPQEKMWSFGHWAPMVVMSNAKDEPVDSAPARFEMKPLYISPCLKNSLNQQQRNFVDRYDTLSQDPIWPSWDGFGNVQYDIFKTLLPQLKPKFVHYIFNDVEVAHHGTWSQYVLAIKAGDEKIYEIWGMINNDPYYKGNTYLIVAVDHSRNPYYMHHDQNSFYNPPPVWMYIFGPDIKHGAVINRPIKHVDIFATLARLLEIQASTTAGSVLEDCFVKK